jgi:hypothetical protein
MNKKIITSVGIVATITTFAAILVASAQTTTTSTSTSSGGVALPGKQEHPILQVGPEGRVLMRGTIASVANGVLTVNSWGGVWTVNAGSGVKVLPEAAGNDLTQFKTGDFVGVQGTVSQSANWTIDATLIRDWTYRQVVNQERQQNIRSENALRKSSTPRNYVGTASNVNGNSFTLTVNGVAYTVNVVSGAEVVNRNWLTMPLSSIQSGDNVRAWGVNASGTISASIVRDVSVPATTGAH